MTVRKAFFAGSRLATTSLALYAGILSAAPPTGLNAPIPPPTMTVGSEIKRGADAGDRCANLFTMPTNAGGFINCIDARQSSNRQATGTGYEAYDVGLYFTAKMNITVAIEVLGKGNPSIGTLQATLNLYDVRYRQARDKLHLSDAEVQRGVILGN